MGQVVSWIVLVAPWLLLLPLDSKRVKQFMPVALFMVALYTILFQMAERWNWWNLNANVFFLTNISSFVYGFLIVFTYPNVWLFLIANWMIDAIQAFVISPYIFQKLGLYSMKNMSNFGLFVMIAVTVPIVYAYQKWQETIFAERNEGFLSKQFSEKDGNH